MRKLFRTILVVLGAVAAVGVFAGLSFGASSIFHKYIDAKTPGVTEIDDSSNPSDSKDSSRSSSSGGASSSSEAPISSSDPGSSSSDPGSSSSEPPSSSEEPQEPEEVGLVLSKSKIFLDSEDHESAASDTITATVTGCNSTVTWLVTSSNYVAVSEATTNSGEANTVSCEAIFENVENIRVSLTDDPTIYEDVKVYYLNEPDQLSILTIGLGLGNSNYDRATVTRYNNPHTYNQNDLYFDCNTYVENNRDCNFLDTAQEAMTAGKCLNATYSPGATVAIEVKVRPNHRSYDVQWPAPYEDFEFFDYWNWYDEELSTIDYQEITCAGRQNISLYWVYRIDITLADDFSSKTGDIVMNFGGKFFCVHLNAYLPGVTGVSSGE